MRIFANSFLIGALVTCSVACHPGPILRADAQPSVGGTIAGTVSATGGSARLSSRLITVVNVSTGARYETTTSSNGGYTVKVPEGTYRIEVELREGETLAKRPDETQVNNGDLDPARNFEVTGAPTK